MLIVNMDMHLDYETLDMALGKMPRVLVVADTEIEGIAHFIKTKSESLRFNDKDLVIEYLAPTDDDTKKFQNTFPRLFDQQNKDPDADVVLFITDVLKFEKERLLKALKNKKKHYTQIIAFVQHTGTEKEALLRYELKEAGFVPLLVPMVEINPKFTACMHGEPILYTILKEVFEAQANKAEAAGTKKKEEK